MNMYKGKDILVTGGCGSIGSELVSQLLQFNPKKIRVFDNRESGHFHLKQKINSDKIRYLLGDVRDKDRLLRAMEGVDIVFHCAALKHVDIVEYNPFDSVLTNVIGTQNALAAAIEREVKYFVTISTDKAVAPTTTMGCTKLLAEKLTCNAPTGTSKMKVACVRFGNVLNSDGSVIPKFMDQIKNNKPITVTSTEMTRFFMTIQDAVNLILKVPYNIISYPDYHAGGDIFVLNNMKSFKIIDLAYAMKEKYNMKIPLEVIGIRPGEKLHESLFSQEELPYVKKVNELYVIKNQIYCKPGKKINVPFSSDKVKLMSKDEIKQIL